MWARLDFTLATPLTIQENGQNEKRGVWYLSECVIAVRSLIQIWTSNLKKSTSTKSTSVFKDPDVTETLSIIHDKYVVVPADKSFIYKNEALHWLLKDRLRLW